MKLVIKTPTRAYIESATTDEMEALTKELTYTNTSAAHQLKRHYNNKWFRSKNPDGWNAVLEELKKNIKHTLVFNDDKGVYIRPGSIPYLVDQFDIEVENEVKYPTPKKIAWAKPLPFTLHPYQESSWQKLVDIKHGNVELCTSAGKSPILLKMCRETGFKAAIIAPGTSIFYELLEKFEHHLGRNNVGSFGDGKKKIGKRITVCIADSIQNVKPGTPEWEFFSTCDMIGVDESHTWGADSLDEICHGIFENVPVRFFCSGTQTRNDGSEKKLQSIIGKTVETLTTAQAVQGGFISDHEFRIVDVESSDPNFKSLDPLELKRAHFLNNKNIAAVIAKTANAVALAYGQQTLVLVEELQQISMLIKLLKVPFAYAHSEKKKARLEELGLEKVDPAESVEKFNRNEVKVLIGTSCIATGTNIFPTHHTHNWVGGSSEIKTKQGAVGRSVRKHEHNPWKDKCVIKIKSIIWDYYVKDVESMIKQLGARVLFYRDSGVPITRVSLKRS